MAIAGSAPGVVRAATVLHDVTGYTSTAAGVVKFTMLAFDDDGRVLATGGEDVAAAYPDSVTIDGRGRFVLPGLIDAHAHLYSLGFLSVSLDLVGAPTLSDVLDELAAYADANRHARWLLGFGWNQVLWPVREFPQASDIDAVVADRPVWLERIDGHAGWANSLALEIAGIDDSTPDPSGGRILRDARGRATGVLIDNAMALVIRHLPVPDKKAIRTAYKAANDDLVALGLTGAHDAGVDVEQAEVLMSMAADGELDLRVYAMLAGAGETLDAVDRPLRSLGDDRLDIAAVKLYADGALGSRGAALLEAYADDEENRGLLFWKQAELEDSARKANDLGFQVAIHAIGDRANRVALGALAAVQGGRASPLRNRIEHAQVIAPGDMLRFAELGVIASMQPTHATSDMNMAEDRVGSARIRGAYAWRRLLDSGAIIAGGSDFPVEKANPFFGLHAAITRQDRDGLPRGGWYVDQAMSRAEALHSFTLGAAYAAHREDRVGSLEPWKWADFIIVDRDFFEIPAAEIAAIRVLETWIGGRRVFKDKTGSEP